MPGLPTQTELFHCFVGEAFPEFWDRLRQAKNPNVAAMAHQVQHTLAGEGLELSLPDAVITVKIDAAHTDSQFELFEVDAPRGPVTPLHRTPWPKAYYVLSGRMIVQVEDEGFDLGPGSAITIPPGALHTETVLSSLTKYLALGLTGAMGRFFADLDATGTHGRPIDEVAQVLQEVLTRHDVTVAGFEPADLESVP